MSHTSQASNEALLIKATELSNNGQKVNAIDTIRDYLFQHHPWHPSLEQVMMLYVRLCVETLEHQYLKDGFYQFKNTMVSQKDFSLAPLENVFRELTTLIEAKIEETKTRVAAEPAVQTGLTESIYPGESVLPVVDPVLTSLNPLFRFFFEAFRTMIDTLKLGNLVKFEPLFFKVVTQALNFTLNNQRKLEFGNFSEILRTLMETLFKNPGQIIPESTINMHIEIRFNQINIALNLGLYNLAYKSIEEINMMFSYLPKPKSHVLATYFQKLAQIYWITNAHLLHAYSLYKHYFYHKNYNTNFSQEDSILHASILLVAAISSPIQESNANSNLLQFDHQSQRGISLASLLSLTSFPKREVFLQEVRKVTNNVFPELQDLYSLFEEKCSPLTFATQLEPKIKFIENHPQLKQYLKPLLKVIFTKIAIQVSKVYEVIKISEFVKLIPFYTKNQIELYLLEAVKRKLIGARVDHKNFVIRFGHYDFDSAKIADQLSNLSMGLHSAIKMIDPEMKQTQNTANTKKEVYVKIINSLMDEHRRILARKEIIEKKKIYMEQQDRLKKQKEQEEYQKKLQQKAEKDQQRLREDLERREKEQKEAQQQSQISQTISAYDKAKTEMAAKITKYSKQLYTLERAFREEELPIVEKLFDTRKVEDREYHEKLQTELLQSHKAAYEYGLAEKNRLNRIKDDFQSFTSTVLEERKKHLPTLQKQQQDRFQAFLKKQEEEQKTKREQRAEAKRIAAEKKAREEEERRIQQIEQERLEQERKEKERTAPYVPPSSKRRDQRDDDSFRRGDRDGGDNWRRVDDRPPREEGGSWRRGEDRPPREGGDNWRSDRPRDDRPPREEGGGSWRSDRPPRDGGDNWRSDRPREDRPPREEGGGSWRSDRPPREGSDNWRSDRPREDRPPREGGDNWRSDRPRDDRPPREEGGGSWRSDRPPREGGDNWRSDRPRDDRPPREEGGGSWRSDRPREDRPPRDGGDNWRRNDGDRPPRDDRPPRNEGDNWRSPPPAQKKEDDDGWTTVGSKKKR
eukprot:gene4252-5321_t